MIDSCRINTDEDVSVAASISNIDIFSEWNRPKTKIELDYDTAERMEKAANFQIGSVVLREESIGKINGENQKNPGLMRQLSLEQK